MPRPMNYSLRLSKVVALIVLSCSTVLLAIWPIPETIALRHGLLILGCISSVYVLGAFKRVIFTPKAWPFWLFFCFYGWLLIHLAFFAHEYDLQLKELSSLWLRSLLATPIGLALGLILSQQAPTDEGGAQNISPQNGHFWVVGLIFLGLCATFWVFFGRYLYEIYVTHQWLHYEFYAVPYKAKTPFVVASALFLPLCLLLITRALQSLMNKWWILLALLGIGLCLFGNYFSGTKNGMAIVAVALGLFFIHSLISMRWTFKRCLVGIPVLMIVLLMGFYGIEKHIQQNTAWPNIVEDIKLGIDIEHQKQWSDRAQFGLPVNPLGNQVNISTYERTAWFTAGMKLLAEHPLGYGLAHHSFGSYAMTRWPNFYTPLGNMRGATHSGWMDFALGFGIPGLLLVLIPLFASWYRSLFQEGIWFSYASSAIPLMIFAYLIAEVTGSHFTELLFFMTAFFCGITLRYPRTYVPNNADEKTSR